MTLVKLNAEDHKLIKSLGIPPGQITAQVEMFKKGATPIKIARAARINDGIHLLLEDEKIELIDLFSHHLPLLDIIKFVPASGAATRMFKTLLSLYNNNSSLQKTDIDTKTENGNKDFAYLRTFIQGMKDRLFAFYDDLDKKMTQDHLNLDSLLQHGDIRPVLEYLLTPRGLDYANQPKALLKFHRYGNYCRTSLEEHLAEGISYSLGKNNVVRIHFTVSPQFLKEVKTFLDIVIPQYWQKNSTFEVQLSEQHPSTNTIAVDENNQLSRDKQGHLTLRPGGHGALIQNLNNLDGDIIFIKNIDNAVPDHLKYETILFKKILGGYLLKLQSTIFRYLSRLTTTPNAIDNNEINEMISFAQNSLDIDFPKEINSLSQPAKLKLIKSKLDRPIRVCGMVKNEGEPGGGPFWVIGKDHTLSLQIVEGAQIDKNSTRDLDIFNTSTHFNPVDLVCGIKNFQGKRFNLMDFVDPDTYFISTKSNNGNSLKALELPGLWNGAMANWTTVFVEVPIITFNPIKTVNDLLRKEHHGSVNPC